MRVVIEHQSEPRLKIIPEIPDLRVCQLEGRNGIGKSLAVRLLELVSGRQPYLALPRAWVSLRESLKDAVITVDHLRGGETVQYRLTPKAWPTDVNDPLPLEDIAEVRINGKRSTMAAARKLVQVERLAGDETLAHTLAADLAAQHNEIQPFVDRLETAVTIWQRRADSVLVTSRAITPEALQSAWRLVEVTSESRNSASQALVGAGEAEWSFRQAAALRVRAAKVRHQLPRLVQQFADTEERLAELRATRESLDVEHAEVLAKRSRNAAARAEAERLDRLQRRRQTVLNNRSADVFAERDWLGLDTEPDSASLAELASAARSDLQSAILRRTELDVVGPLIELGDALAGPLQQAVDEGMGSQPIADLDRPVLAEELLSGVTLRRNSLAGQPRPGQLDSLDAEIGRLRQRQSHIGALQSGIQARDRAQELVDDVEAQLAGPDFASSSQAQKVIAEIRERQAQAHRDLVETEVRLRVLAAELEELQGDDPGELEKQAAAAEEVVRALVREPSEASVLDVLTRAQAAAEAAESEYVAAADRLAGLRSTMSSLIYELNSDPEQAWLRAGWSTLAGSHSPVRTRAGECPSDAELAQAANIEKLSNVVERFGDLTVAVRDNTAAASDYLTVLGGLTLQRARGGKEAARSFQQTEIGTRVRRFLEQRYGAQFSQEPLLELLFEGADAVQLDLAEYRLSWMDENGERRHRPLEAFSSGQQAFAYTLARLDIVAARNQSASNLMVVLDEFGAFVARDRLGELLRAVATSADRLLEQVVIVLPLSSDYSAIAQVGADVPGVEAERARQVEARGYFALTPTTI